MRAHKAKFGQSERLSFSKIKDILDTPYLIEVQKDSFKEFLEGGIDEVFGEFSPVESQSGNLELNFLGFKLDGAKQGEDAPIWLAPLKDKVVGKLKYSEKECKERDATYSLPLKVKVQLIKKETGEVVEQEVFLGDFPVMTQNGSFIVNGAERVVVSQLIRSPGVYCGMQEDVKTGKPNYKATAIPSRGAWLEFEEDGQSVLWVQVDRTRKAPASVLLRSLGYASDKQILEIFGDEPIIKATLDKDVSSTEDEGLIELYKRLRPGETPTPENVRTHLQNLFFDPKRYDLGRPGRYKFNKKLCIATRIINQVSFDDLSIGSKTLIKKGETFTREIAFEIKNAGINEVYIKTKTGQKHKVIGNNTIDINTFVKGFSGKDYGILENVHYPTLMQVIKGAKTKDAQKEAIIKAGASLVSAHITRDDIIAIINYLIGLPYGLGTTDNIDHLGNRRVRSVGELLKNQFRIGVSRLERIIKERMNTQDINEVTPQSLINIRPVTSAIKEFFGSSQLSQFMDQSNPLAELTHKRKVSALGPGGLNRERASFDVRDVHHSHYGRICPIETPEGQNIGLISSLSTYAKINEYGFIESPYRAVKKVAGKDGKVEGIVTQDIHYLTADEEDKFIIAQANEPLTKEGKFVNARVMCRQKEDIKEVDCNVVDYMDVSPKQLVSVATSLIPFLENDDTNRALMGSNMQRQAVPLLKPTAPIIGTGMEHTAARDSGVMLIADFDATVDVATAETIVLKGEKGQEAQYTLQKFLRSNQGTCINQRPLVSKGQKVKKGDIIADGPSTENGELALGQNVLVGFMSWEGYNFEDAILISERLVKDDVYTSIHIEEHEIESRDTKLGAEEITRDIPNISDDALAHLDKDGVIRVGAEVRSGDILVGKVTPKGETELTPEERLLRAIFGDKAREVRDTSLKVPHGEGGIVVDVKIFTRANKDELPPGVNQLIRVYVAQKRKISVGDKMAGRHGNKGVISRILPLEDMPFLDDGTPLDIVLSPIGVPSRMNIGQLLEVHLGLVASKLGVKFATPVFDGAREDDIQDFFKEINSPLDGKLQLFDGRTGKPFENRVTVGHMYMLKLVHLVDDKIHARSTGPYSLVTQQPLGGKAQFGGQRFGEMEVWALEAYGAANILQEILTVKSDDVVGRVKTYESIVKGQNISEPGIPEAFKVLIKEFQSLGLDVRVLTEDKEEITLKEITAQDRSIMDIKIKDDFLDEIELDELEQGIEEAEFTKGVFDSTIFDEEEQLADAGFELEDLFTGLDDVGEEE